MSIRLKFLFVMTSLLMLCLGVYLLMAVTVFKSDKTQLVFDLNRSQVSNLTSELETGFQGVSEKLKLFALMTPEMQERMSADMFADGGDLVAVSVYKDDKAVREFVQDEFLETYGLKKDFFQHARDRKQIPFDQILRAGEHIWNASVPDGPPLIGYGRLVVMQDQKGVPIEQWAVVGHIKLDRFLKSVSIVRLSEVFVSNRAGEVLVHPDAKTLLNHPNVNDDPLFQAAVSSNARISVTNREIAGERWLAALGQGFNNQIVVVAKAGEGEVFRVVRDLTVRTLLFGTIVLTLVILAAFLVSRSLTQNIGLLVERMEGVSQGDLSTQISLRGRDETVTLGNAFNDMISDLKRSRDALEEMNRELDQKVKERTAQLEEQNKKIKEVQEALIRTTRLASVGEIAGRTAHEVLNPLTILLTRAGLLMKRVNEPPTDELGLIDDIRKAWRNDYTQGGFDGLVSGFKSESHVMPGHNLFEEDLANLERASSTLREHHRQIAGDVGFIKSEGERIGKIINGMRRLGSLQSNLKPQSVHTIINDCRQIMADLFDQKGFFIDCQLNALDDTCSVDRDELIQALTNLMRNSLQALDEAQAADPSPTAEFRMHIRTETQGGEFCIEIEDNGSGVKPEHQGRLFESSFTTKSPDHGTGLGLGISRRFVRSFGGDIEFVTSKPKERTVFRIRIPLHQGLDQQGAVA